MVVYRLKSSNSPGFPTIKTETGRGLGRKKTSADTATTPSPSAPRAEPPRPSGPTVSYARPPGLDRPVHKMMSPRKRIAATRQKIEESDLTQIMLDFVAGRVTLTSEQVAAGMGLMDKIVPDLAKADIEAEEEEDDESPDFEVCIVDPKA